MFETRRRAGARVRVAVAPGSDDSVLMVRLAASAVTLAVAVALTFIR